MAEVQLRGVTKRFDDTVAVDGVDLDVTDGEFLVLLGPSGCGKSTLLRLIAGLEQATAGSVAIGGLVVDDVPPSKRDVAMVFQSYALYPHKTVRKNIEVPLRSRKVPAVEREQLVSEAAGNLGLDELLDRKPAQLSGGQRQRVALARALVRRPSVFLLDEPLSNLDAALRVQTRAELVALHERLETTFVHVTHDQVEAMTMADRVVILDRGRLQQIGSPSEVYARPANTMVARFLGSPPMDLLDAELFEDGEALAARVGSAVLTVGGEALDAARRRGGRHVQVGVRPEHVDIHPDGPLTTTVVLSEDLGHEHVVRCVTDDGQRIAVRVDAERRAPDEGDRLRLRPRPDRLHLFDADSGMRR